MARCRCPIHRFAPQADEYLGACAHAQHIWHTVCQVCLKANQAVSVQGQWRGSIGEVCQVLPLCMPVVVSAPGSTPEAELGQWLGLRPDQHLSGRLLSR